MRKRRKSSVTNKIIQYTVNVEGVGTPILIDPLTLIPIGDRNENSTDFFKIAMHILGHEQIPRERRNSRKPESSVHFKLRMLNKSLKKFEKKMDNLYKKLEREREPTSPTLKGRIERAYEDYTSLTQNTGDLSESHYQKQIESIHWQNDSKLKEIKRN